MNWNDMKPPQRSDIIIVATLVTLIVVAVILFGIAYASWTGGVANGKESAAAHACINQTFVYNNTKYVTDPSADLLLDQIKFYAEEVQAARLAEPSYVGLSKSDQCDGVRDSQLTTIKPVGMSMYPSMRPGATVKAVRYDPRKPLVEGDVVAAEDHGNLIEHRVVGVYPTYFLMKGDNNRVRDPVNYSYAQARYVVCVIDYR